jgi:hypothetical protein
VSNPTRRRIGLAAAAFAVATGGALATSGAAIPLAKSAVPTYAGVKPKVGAVANEGHEILSAFQQFYGARSAPGNIAPGAYTAAFEHVKGMPVAPAIWSEVTTKPYNADSAKYRDLVAGNSSGGVGYVTGRITGLAVDGKWIYAGGAEGGVFRSSDEGKTWTAISDRLPALATGDLQVAPDHSLWIATGEANFGDGLGSGVYRLAKPQTGVFDASMRVGGKELESHAVGKLEFDPEANTVVVATTRGIYIHAMNVSTGPWGKVLAPVSGPSLNATSNIANDVVVQPGTKGKKLLANLAWRGGSSYNAFYTSSDAGRHWAPATLTGDINNDDIGPANMAYSADGKKLYVVMQSPDLFNDFTSATALGGIFVSNGSLTGPFTKVADSLKLAGSGSAQDAAIIGPGYGPGVQAWYNRFIKVDPANPKHAYVGLEEVYETFDAGTTWKAVGRYWNFGFDCWSYIDAENTCDGNVIHPDQHSVAIGNGKLYAGNDGGLYSRSLAKTTTSWTSLSKTGQLRTLQYYSVGVGKVPGGVAVWGGLQDNGVSLLSPADAEMVSPFGGDGGDQIVDRTNGCRTVGEYVYLHMQVTTNCGATDGSVAAIKNIDPLDPNPQFIAPMAADSVDPGYWVAGGQFVYGNSKTWASTTGADWDVVGDIGDFGDDVYHSATSIASQNHVVWAGWCGSCSSSTFKSGIATTAGTGVLHQAGNLVVNRGPGVTLPNRYVSGVTVDRRDTTGQTAYAVYNGFSAHWVEGPGAGIGHVFKTTDGGAHWYDISGTPSAADSLPDVPASHLAITPKSNTLILTTDVGVFQSAGNGKWSKVGTSFPYTIATDVRVGPDGYTYIATFGRGIWKMPTR